MINMPIQDKRERFITAIKIVLDRLKSADMKVAVVGGTNLMLHGMDVELHDLDIIIEPGTLEKARSALAEYSPSEVRRLDPIVNDAWEVKLEIDGVEVQILTEDEGGVYVSKLSSNRLDWLEVEGIKVPTFRLDAEADAYSETGRQGKADMVRRFMASKR